MSRTYWVPVISLLLLLAGCGGQDAASGDTSTAAPARISYQPSEIKRALQTRPDGSEDAFTTETGVKCDVNVFLTDASSVKLYAGAGDPVATNKARTAGVKLDVEEAQEAACLKTGAARLQQLH